MVDIASLLSTSEAAQRAGITERGMRKAIERGRLQARRLGRDWFVQADDLERWIVLHPGRGRPALVESVESNEPVQP
jgi:excisionase family DNA binding protein